MNNNLTDLKEELNFIHFKKFFLLEFTRQLIKHSSPSDIFKLQTILERERKYKIEGVREKIKERIKNREDEFSTSAKEIEGGEIEKRPSILHAPIGMFETQKLSQINPFEKTFQKTPPKNLPPKKNYFADPFKKIRLSIPESKFPAYIQYIKPVPVNKDIELGKLNPLINDPMVNLIECYGPGEKIVVQGGMGIKRTGIVLDRDEIDEVIQKFSRETKIPIQEGIFKVVAGRLIFLAIISGIVASKFTIKKMPLEQTNQGI